MNGRLFMILEVDKEKRTIMLYDPILDYTIHHAAKDQDELDIYSYVFEDCREINLFLSVEYDVQKNKILVS